MSLESASFSPKEIETDPKHENMKTPNGQKEEEEGNTLQNKAEKKKQDKKLKWRSKWK